LGAVVSCNKEKFPNRNDLKGTWIEKTAEGFTPAKLIFKEDTLYEHTPTFPVFAYTYRLDRKYRKLRVVSIDGTFTSSRKIVINKEKDELTLKGLFGNNPAFPPLETTYKRE
jgi:hypothetical protein